MKKLLVLSAVGVLALVPVAATAQTPDGSGIAVKRSTGTTVSYTSGKLRIKMGTKTVLYTVDAKTSCGYRQGRKGREMRCSNLSNKKYLTKPVRVSWYTDARKRRVATVVSLDMTTRK
jgi:hypothetical protein